MTIDRDKLTKTEAVTIAAIEGAIMALVDAREIVADFPAKIRKNQAEALSPRLDRTPLEVLSLRSATLPA